MWPTEQFEFETLVKLSKPHRGDIFGDINSHKHLATLIPGVLLDILQQVSSGYLSS